MVKVKLTLISSLRALTHNPSHLSSYAFPLKPKTIKCFVSGFFYFVCFFPSLTTLHSLWDLSSPTKDWIEPIPSAMKAWSPNHWTSREAIGKICFKKLKKCCDALLLLLSHSVVSDSLQPHGLQHARLPGPSLSPGVSSNSCPLSQWCHPTITSSVVPFSSRLQSFPATGSFQMSQFFSSGGQSIGVSASTSVLPMNIQDWYP